MDGVCLNHLRFANDLVLISTDVEELNIMIKELKVESRKIRLSMNLNKTKILNNFQQDVTIGNISLEKDDEYIYFGHTVKLDKENQIAEIMGTLWKASLYIER